MHPPRLTSTCAATLHSPWTASASPQSLESMDAVARRPYDGEDPHPPVNRSRPSCPFCAPSDFAGRYRRNDARTANSLHLESSAPLDKMPELPAGVAAEQLAGCLLVIFVGQDILREQGRRALGSTPSTHASIYRAHNRESGPCRLPP